MSRKFISFVLATSIAITGISTQTAQAGDRDLARFLAGAAALIVIGAAINDNNKRKNQHVIPNNNHHVKPRPLPNRVSRKLLPAQCERNARTRDGRVKVFAARCLDRKFRGAAHLPRQCAGNFKYGNRDHGRRPAYTKRCLRSFGYRTARN